MPLPERIAHTVDAQGFVCVDGARVLNNRIDGKPVYLKHRPIALVTCQICHRVNVEVPQHVVRWFEAALDMWRHWHASPVGAHHIYRHCAECKEAA